MQNQVTPRHLRWCAYIVFVLLQILACGGSDFIELEEQSSRSEHIINYISKPTHSINNSIVSLHHKSYGFFCTGTLVTQKHILTAAHCADGKSHRRIRVALGVHYDDKKKSDLLRVESIKVHPLYSDPSHLGVDLAIMTLENEVRSEEAQPAHIMARPKIEALMQSDFEEYYVAGYGLTQWDSVSSSLNHTHAMLGAEINKAVARHPIFKDAFNDQNEFGMINGRGTVCNGDSGGPVFQRSQLGLEIIGVNSYTSSGCGPLAVAARLDTDTALTFIFENIYPSSCDNGFHDIDGNADNGCEYACQRQQQLDGCRGRDENCDGMIDSGSIAYTTDTSIYMTYVDTPFEYVEDVSSPLGSRDFLLSVTTLPYGKCTGELIEYETTITSLNPTNVIQSIDADFETADKISQSYISQLIGIGTPQIQMRWQHACRSTEPFLFTAKLASAEESICAGAGLQVLTTRVQ